MRLVFIVLALSGSLISLQAQTWVDMLTDSAFNFHEARKAFEQYIDTMDKSERIPGRKQFDRISYFLDSRVDELGRHPRPDGTWVEYNRLMKEEASGGKFSPSANWLPLGPFVTPVNSPGMGRINCIAFHPTQSSIMWAGAASGGVWKTTTSGAYWHPMADNIASLGISSIVVDYQNPDIIYAATGDFNASDTYSVGVLKSLDGGNTWNTTGLSWPVSDQRRISRLIIHPSDPNTLYAATTLGIYKSTNGGSNWNQIRPGSTSDIAFKPGNPAVIYAILNNKFIRSVDNGGSFLSLNIPSVDQIGRAKLAVTNADPDYVYVITVKSSDSGFEGLYRSTDGGSNFTRMSGSPNILGYATDGSSSSGIAWYCLGVAVSPVNKNEIFVASVNIWRSINGGSSWQIRAHWYGDEGLPYVHADIHYMDYHPITGALYVCSDGGIDVTSNSGSSFQAISSGLAIGQVYRIGLSKQDYSMVIGGWQDNGTHLLKNNTWKHMLGGDGMECIVSHTNSSYMYGEMQYGRISRSYNGGNHWNNISDDIGEEGSWITPYIMHPTNHSTLIAGYDNLWRSTNYGSSWVPLTSFTSTGYYDKFRSLAYSHSNPNYIYAATYNRIYRTNNSGQSWVQINNNLPSYPITYIAVNHSNPLVVYVTLSGFYSGKKVFMTTNGGSSWTNISGSLPNLPANCIIHEKGSNGGLYVGMDVGVFYRDSTLTDWVNFFQGLPNVKIAELEIHYDSHRLVAATYGRGIWWSDTYTWLNQVNEIHPGTKSEFNVFPNPSDGNFTISLNNKDKKISAISIISPAGNIIRRWDNPENKIPGNILNIENDEKIPQGIYLIMIQLQDGSITSGKIIIRH